MPRRGRGCALRRDQALAEAAADRKGRRSHSLQYGGKDPAQRTRKGLFAEGSHMGRRDAVDHQTLRGSMPLGLIPRPVQRPVL